MKRVAVWIATLPVLTSAGMVHAETLGEPRPNAFIWDGIVHAELERSDAPLTIRKASLSILETSSIGFQRTFDNRLVVGALARYSWQGRKHSGYTLLVACPFVGFELRLHENLRAVPKVGFCYTDRRFEGGKLRWVDPFVAVEGLIRLTEKLTLSYGPRFTWFWLAASSVQGTEVGWAFDRSGHIALAYDMGLRIEF